jgi:hypothetical protein
MTQLQNVPFRWPLQLLWKGCIAVACLMVSGWAVAQGHRVGAFDFGYASTGDARVLPVQVFDDGVHTFFQFRAGEAPPAIFAEADAQVRLLLPQPHGPFWRVEDRHGRFLLQAGRARAMVVHLGSDRPGAPAWMAQGHDGNPVAPLPGDPPAGTSAAARLVGALPQAREPDDAFERNSYAQPLRGDRAVWTAPVRSPTASPRTVAPIVSSSSSASSGTSGAATSAALAVPPSAPRLVHRPAAVAPVPIEPAQPPLEFEVQVSDPSLRHVLVRWARLAGWIHGPDHWAVDRDLPVVAPAGPEIFGLDFREAVRRLLGSSELTDRPVQPCFYSNRVVRVISRGDTCSRTTESG